MDGSNDYITVPDAGSLDITGAITLSYWLRSTDTDAGHMSKSLAAERYFGIASSKVYEIGILSGYLYPEYEQNPGC